jgi:hypothetical protein
MLFSWSAARFFKPEESNLIRLQKANHYTLKFWAYLLIFNIETEEKENGTI